MGKVISSGYLAGILLTFLVINLIGCAPDSSNGGGGSLTTTGIDIACANNSGASSVINVAWEIPLSYTNNTPLYISDIEGYRLYVGTYPRQYTQTITITDVNMTSCSIPVSISNTYYIAMTVVTKDGMESDYSNEVIRTL